MSQNYTRTANIIWQTMFCFAPFFLKLSKRYTEYIHIESKAMTAFNICYAIAKLKETCNNGKIHLFAYNTPKIKICFSHSRPFAF